MENALLDTDVILDFFFDRRPFAQFATEVLNRCEQKQLNGFTTPLIIANVYYLLRKTAKHDVTVEKIKQLLSIVEVISMNKEMVLASLNSDFKDFEDALQNFSATQHGLISVILTRNIKDFSKSKLAVLTPETYLKATSI